MDNSKENIPISVVILTKNEESNIRDCVASVQWAQQVIVFDSGSTDDTCNIARGAGARVIESMDWEGYGIQRQRAQENTDCDWILMLDADERVSGALASEIKDVVSKKPCRVAYAIPRLSWCFGKFIRHGGWYPDYVTRLYQKKEAEWDSALVHERLRVTQDVFVDKLSNPLIHFTYRDVRHYVEKSATYAGAWAERKRLEGKKAGTVTAFLHAVGAFVKMYFLRVGFLDGKQGFMLSVLSSFSVFAKYAQLWEVVRAEESADRTIDEKDPAH